MKSIFIFLSLMPAVCPLEAADLSGKITAIDPARGTLEISGVTVEAKGAEIRGFLTSSSLKKLKPGDKVEVRGSFSGPRLMRAGRIEKKIFKHYEINAALDEVNKAARVLDISGITIEVPEGVPIEDFESKPATIAKLAKGYIVEVEGNWTGRGIFTASKIEMRNVAEAD